MFLDFAKIKLGIPVCWVTIDQQCNQIGREEFSERYDVVVAPNLVGDVISDNGSFVQGGMGMAPAGNIGDAHAMFEPVHGSAPTLAGKDAANPIATILAVALMLKWLGEVHDDARLLQASGKVEQSVVELLQAGELLPQDLGGQASCSQIGEALLHQL